MFHFICVCVACFCRFDLRKGLYEKFSNVGFAYDSLMVLSGSQAVEIPTTSPVFVFNRITSPSPPVYLFPRPYKKLKSAQSSSS